jgi:hypothetical protein
MDSAAKLGGELSAGRLGEGYFYRQYYGGWGFMRTCLDTTVYWVPPLLPFLERPVARSYVEVDPPPVTRRNTGGTGERRLVVMHEGSAIDELVY